LLLASMDGVPLAFVNAWMKQVGRR